MQSTAVVIYKSTLSVTPVFTFVIMIIIGNLGKQKFRFISMDRTFCLIDIHY